MDMPIGVIFLIVLVLAIIGAALVSIVIYNIYDDALVSKAFRWQLFVAAAILAAIACFMPFYTVAGAVCRIKHGPVDVVFTHNVKSGLSHEEIISCLKKRGISEEQIKRAYYIRYGRRSSCGKHLLHAVVPKLTETQKLAAKYDELTKDSAL